MSRYPVDSITIASGYGVRIVRGAAQGHWGYDLAGAEGTEVKAPEAMTVTQVWHDDVTPPFVGYGPGGVEGLGASGVYHLLAHLEPSTIGVSVGDQIEEGHSLGRMPSHVGAAGPHTHWEVRKREIDSPATRENNTIVPNWWVQAARNGWTTASPQQPPVFRSSAWLWLLLAAALILGDRHG